MVAYQPGAARGGGGGGATKLFLIATLLHHHLVTSQMALPTPTLLDRMNLAKDRLSPGCSAALPTLDPTTTSKANFATGRIGEVRPSYWGGEAKLLMMSICTHAEMARECILCTPSHADDTRGIGIIKSMCLSLYVLDEWI